MLPNDALYIGANLYVDFAWPGAPETLSNQVNYYLNNCYVSQLRDQKCTGSFVQYHIQWEVNPTKIADKFLKFSPDRMCFA